MHTLIRLVFGLASLSLLTLGCGAADKDSSDEKTEQRASGSPNVEGGTIGETSSQDGSKTDNLSGKSVRIEPNS